jgi:hypothetical protein
MASFCCISALYIFLFGSCCNSKFKHRTPFPLASPCAFDESGNKLKQIMEKVMFKRQSRGRGHRGGKRKHQDWFTLQKSKS